MIIYDHLHTIRLLRLTLRERTLFSPVTESYQIKMLRLLVDNREYKCRLVVYGHNLLQLSKNNGSNLHRLRNFPLRQLNEAQGAARKDAE